MTVMLSCHVIGEVCVVVADHVEMLARLGVEEEVVGGDVDHDGEFSEPGSKDER